MLKENEENTDLINRVKQALLNGDSEIGYVVSHCESYYMPSDEKKPEMISRPMPKKLYDLGQESIGFPETIWFGGLGTTDVAYENEFIPYGECTDEQKKKIDIRRKKVEQFAKKVSEDKTGKYDKVGKISIPVFKTNRGAYVGNFPRVSAESKSSIEIEVTQRELAQAGILPEDFRWTERARVSPRNIAEVENKEKLTTTDLAPIESKGFKMWIKNIKETITKLLQGKGEK